MFIIGKFLGKLKFTALLGKSRIREVYRTKDKKLRKAETIKR
jgi:hypothetical protein